MAAPAVRLAYPGAGTRKALLAQAQRRDFGLAEAGETVEHRARARRHGRAAA